MGAFSSTQTLTRTFIGLKEVQKSITNSSLDDMFQNDTGMV